MKSYPAGNPERLPPVQHAILMAAMLTCTGILFSGLLVVVLTWMRLLPDDIPRLMTIWGFLDVVWVVVGLTSFSFLYLRRDREFGEFGAQFLGPVAAPPTAPPRRGAQPYVVQSANRMLRIERLDGLGLDEDKLNQLAVAIIVRNESFARRSVCPPVPENLYMQFVTLLVDAGAANRVGNGYDLTPKGRYWLAKQLK